MPPLAPRRQSLRCARSLAALLTALSACGPGGSPAGNGSRPVVVRTAEAASHTLPKTVSAVGSLESPEPTTIDAEVPGTLVLLDVPEGQRVEAGRVLARIEDSEFRAEVASNRASFRNADDRLQRVRRLYDQGVASQQALDDALSSHDTARADLDASLTRLQKTTIRAPFDGILGLREVSRGAYVEPGDPIVRITQVDPLDLVFGVPQRYAGQVAAGQKVLGIVGRCEGRLEATVTAVDPRVDATTRMRHIEARVSNPDGHLAPGMAVRLRVVTGEMPDAVVVPQEAVVREGTKHLVYVVEPEQTVSPREVVLGAFFLDGVQILRGLKAGEEIVVAGQQKLRPGAKIEAKPRVPTDNPILDLGWLGPSEGCEP